jgi:hypothetical protein
MYLQTGFGQATTSLPKDKVVSASITRLFTFPSLGMEKDLSKFLWEEGESIFNYLRL